MPSIFSSSQYSQISWCLALTIFYGIIPKFHKEINKRSCFLAGCNWMKKGPILNCDHSRAHVTNPRLAMNMPILNCDQTVRHIWPILRMDMNMTLRGCSNCSLAERGTVEWSWCFGFGDQIIVCVEDQSGETKQSNLMKETTDCISHTC